MRICFNRILMCCCLILLLQQYAIGQTAHSCDDAKRIVSEFVNSKKNDDWDKVEVNAYKLQYCKCEMAPVFYYIYRMKVLLPNSHALHGISPNDFIASQKFKMHEQIKILKGCKEKHYLPLINTMRNQDFDSAIAESANELKGKLRHKI